MEKDHEMLKPLCYWHQNQQALVLIIVGRNQKRKKKDELFKTMNRFSFEYAFV